MPLRREQCLLLLDTPTPLRQFYGTPVAPAVHASLPCTSQASAVDMMHYKDEGVLKQGYLMKK